MKEKLFRDLKALFLKLTENPDIAYDEVFKFIVEKLVIKDGEIEITP